MFSKILFIIGLFFVIFSAGSTSFAQNKQTAVKDSTAQETLSTAPVKDSTGKTTTENEPIKDITVLAGTKFNIIIANQLATNRSFKGSTFSANLAADLKVDTIVVSPKNSLVIGKIVESKRGQGLGDAKLSIQINEITVNKELVPVVTEPIIVKGERKRNAEAEIPAGTIEEVQLKSPLVIK